MHDRFKEGTPQHAALSKPDEVYLHGGEDMGNPGGISFTPAQAEAWWDYVFAHGLNISNVRPTLTPGSLVLDDDELAAARELGRTSTSFAPEDFNPLDLPIVP